MSKEIAITLHSVAEDGLPDMDALIGRIAFIWDGAIVSGWPIPVEFDDDYDPDEVKWEPSEDRFGGPVIGVTHWVEFPVAVWNLDK